MKVDGQPSDTEILRCALKDRYLEIKYAENVRERINIRRKKKKLRKIAIRIYNCNICHHYHLTSQTELIKK